MKKILQTLIGLAAIVLPTVVLYKAIVLFDVDLGNIHYINGKGVTVFFVFLSIWISTGLYAAYCVGRDIYGGKDETKT